jgi:hypothetical protein
MFTKEALVAAMHAAKLQAQSAAEREARELDEKKEKAFIALSSIAISVGTEVKRRLADPTIQGNGVALEVEADHIRFDLPKMTHAAIRSASAVLFKDEPTDRGLLRFLALFLSPFAIGYRRASAEVYGVYPAPKNSGDEMYHIDYTVGEPAPLPTSWKDYQERFPDPEVHLPR